MFFPHSFPYASAPYNFLADLPSTTGVTVLSSPHNGDPNAQFYFTGLIATLLDYVTPVASGPIYPQVLVLCDPALLKGTSPDSTGSQSSVGAIAALAGQAGLYPSKLISSVANTMCLSFLLLHEIMHATQYWSYKSNAVGMSQGVVTNYCGNDSHRRIC